MRVLIQGRVYATVQEAASAFNVTARTIQRVIYENREDSLKVKKIGCKRGLPQPITIEGLTFSNQKAANTALGLPFNYLTQAINRNSKKSLEKIAAAAAAYREKQNE